MKRSRLLFINAAFILLLQSCNLPGGAPQQTVQPVFSTETPTLVVAIDTPTIVHQVFPVSTSTSKLYYDVESATTAPEQRAPYGDSYDINRLERPFLEDMSYVSDLDIDAFSLNQDADWFYISIRLIGSDPNNSLGINYGVEFDKNLDGFGDIVIVATPPYFTD